MRQAVVEGQPRRRWRPACFTSGRSASTRSSAIWPNHGVAVRPTYLEEGCYDRADPSSWAAQELIPAIVQDANTRQVLMIAYMNQRGTTPDARERAGLVLEP